ncbi:hypothetical protein AeMF1_005116 [Aphanomyces euteiches]|nr:hypothetical protein AeMF1_005116 [Aphanomyces euteiches]KAH9167439.1 hypothetical protein AeNC1_018150 [Aphanomyces euteiches]
MNDTALLEDVLRANGEEHLYDKIMQLSVHAKDKPPVIFVWKNVEGFVEAIQEARAKASAPGVTIQKFKEAVLEYARAGNAQAALGTTCLPCTLGQFGHVFCSLATLDLHPWTQRILAVGGPKSLPIACVYVPRPLSNTLESAVRHFPNSLWG